MIVDTFFGDEPQIRDQVPGDTARVAKAIRALVEIEVLSKSGKGVRGEPYAYSVRERPDQEALFSRLANREQTRK